MSVLIKGMTMPPNCYDCPFIELQEDNKALCLAGLFEMFGIDIQRRYYICPLVEVPTPHGRLIDADELREKMIKEADHYAPYIHEGIRHGYHNCELLVDDAPTVIEAEE